MLPLWRPDVSSLFGRYLPRHGWDISWFVLSNGNSSVPAWLDSQHVHSTRVTEGKLYGVRRWICERFRDVRAAYSVLVSPPDVFVVRDDYFSLSIVGIACRIRKVKVCYWMSFLMEDGYIEAGKLKPGLAGVARTVYGRLYGFVGRIALRAFAGMVFSQSELMAEVVKVRLHYRGRIQPVHMAVDFELLQQCANGARKTLEVTSELRLCYSGSVSINRGFEALFRGLAVSRANGLPVRLIIVGWYVTESDREYLYSVINEVGISDIVDFVGRVDQVAALSVISACDVGVSPIPVSPLYLVGSPTKLFEYISLGKPVIATEHPVQRAVVGAAQAGVVVSETPLAYANAIALFHAEKIQGKLPTYADRLPEYCERLHSYRVRSSMVNDVLREFLRGG